jgi:uncharacterized protein YndB with AHSA1/START domain
MDACFLVVDELARIVFTNAIDSAWRPTTPSPVAMTAEVTLDDHPEGTRHGNPAARTRHDELGFLDGWGTVTEQLARLAESEAAR